LEGFLKLRPPTFDTADDDPIAAEDWLREMEKKLDLTTCTNEECVGVAAHQLTGTARAWWDSYCDAHEDPGSISWEEFAKAFHEQHVPEGVMDAKVEEFCNISQGSQKVQEYTTRFTRMMRYAPGETDTEKKKMYCFKKGLNSHLKVALPEGSDENQTRRHS
jgi:N-glycosylase/DNA lyase